MSRPLCWSHCCEATGALECMFWEILHKLAELHSTEDILLTPKDGILSTGCTHEDCQLQVMAIAKQGV